MNQDSTDTIIVSPLAASAVKQVHKADDEIVKAASTKKRKKIKVGRSSGDKPNVIRNVRKRKGMHRIVKTDDLEPGMVDSFSVETGYGFLETADGQLYFHSASQRTCVVKGDEIVLSDENPSASSSPEKEPDKWITVKPRNNNQKARTIYVDPRMMIGAKVLYFKKSTNSKRHGKRDSAVCWCIQDDYFKARKELISRPMFRLLRRWIEYGEPRANNETKQFETPETHHEDEMFSGSDLDALRVVLRMHPLEPRFKSLNGQMIDCQWQFQILDNGHWMNCGHPLEVDHAHI